MHTKPYILNKLGVLIVCSACFSLADPIIKSDQSSEIEVTKIKDKDLADKLIKSFISEVLLKRELNSSGNYFCSEIQYLNHEWDFSFPDATLKMNYSHDRDLFLDDCSKILNMMPKVNPDHIRLIKIQDLGVSPISNLSKAKVYKAEFAYEEGIGRFEIIFPSVLIEGENAKFISRFWDVFRLLR